MNNCILCQIIDNQVPSKKIYEDDEILAVLDMNGANPGHSFVMPKQHFTILEQVPDNLVGKLFQIANKIGKALFETLNVQGTNLFITNGLAAGQITPHFMINVIPRNDNDGINLTWQPKKIEEEEMSTIELQIKSSIKDKGIDLTGYEAMPETKRKVETISDEGEENYKINQLKRIP